MALPNTKVEIAFDSGYTTAAASRTWTDVSTYVEGKVGINITRGRQDNISEIQPSTLSLTLDNRDGRFTPEKTAGAYYPNVKMGRPIRVTSTYNAVQYVRFVGYINEWPVVWPDSSSSVSTVTVTASSRRARLGLGGELRDIAEQEILFDTPSAFYPLDEPADSVSASDSSGTGQTPLTLATSGAAPTFGTTTAPGSDESTAATFAAGSPLRSTITFGSAPSSVTVAGFFATTTLNVVLCQLAPLSHPSGTVIGVTNSGRVYVTSQAGSLFSGTGLDDGLTHHFAVVFTAANATLYVDGASIGSSGSLGIALGSSMALAVGGAIDPAETGAVAGLVGVATYTGSLCDISVYPSALSAGRVADQAASGMTGFAGDLSGARIARYAELGGVPTAEQVLDSGVVTIGAISATGQTPIGLIQKVVDTENGILYDAKDSTGSLVFKDRDHRYNLASSFTLNATTQEVQGDLQPNLSDQFLVNDVTATGVDTSARIIDSTSAADYGYYRQSLDVASSDPDAVRALAEWRVGLGDQPVTRYPTVSVDVVNLSTAQAALVLAAEISTRFGLSNLPTQAPATTADFFIEGYTEQITEATHGITFNTSSTYGYTGATGVWQLDVNNIDGPYILAL